MPKALPKPLDTTDTACNRVTASVPGIAINVYKALRYQYDSRLFCEFFAMQLIVYKAILL